MKSSGIKTQNNQALPAGSRLWTPANIGNDLKLWLRPECIRPHNGESSSSSDLAQNKWIDSSSFASEVTAPVSQAFSSVTGLQAQLSSAGNGATFGTQNAKTFDTLSCNGVARGGSLADDAAPQIDPGTGAFTVLSVCRINRSTSELIPYAGQDLTILSDGDNISTTTDYKLQLEVASNQITSPGTIKLISELGTNVHTETIESKEGTSQIFDNSDFLIAYERDGSGNSEMYSNGTSLGTANGQNADLADNRPRNMYCIVSVEISGNFVYTSDTNKHQIAETILINNKDVTTRILCEGYLAHKYGRQDRLPSSHKYRYGPPRI